MRVCVFRSDVILSVQNGEGRREGVSGRNNVILIRPSTERKGERTGNVKRVKPISRKEVSRSIYPHQKFRYIECSCFLCYRHGDFLILLCVFVRELSSSSSCLQGEKLTFGVKVISICYTNKRQGIIGSFFPSSYPIHFISLSEPPLPPPSSKTLNRSNKNQISLTNQSE